MRPSLLDTAGYPEQTIEKVERLLEFLVEIEGHPYLSSRLSLHGGTALNVFHLAMPRLSVDADLTYVGKVLLSQYQAERADVDHAVMTLGERLGYRVTSSSKTEHAGRTLKMHYLYGDQPDLIKVDLIYLNRSPLLESEAAVCTSCSPETTVTTLALPELVAGKTKALFDRLAVRDLYDTYRIQTAGLPLEMARGDSELYRLQRRVRLYYTSLSKPFPCAIDGTVVEKFTGHQRDVERDLYPVLQVHDRPSLGDMMNAASLHITDHVAPREDEEKEYLRQLDEESQYTPRLLFSHWPDVLRRAEESPAAAWKVVNLKKRPSAAPSDYPEW